MENDLIVRVARIEVGARRSYLTDNDEFSEQEGWEGLEEDLKTVLQRHLSYGKDVVASLIEWEVPDA